jgi:glucose/arabinose dehydrogenase
VKRQWCVIGTALLLSLINISTTTAQTPTPLTKVLVASGLSRPLFVVSPPGDTNRVFIIEQTGKIKIMKSGVVQTRPFMDVGSLITTFGNEQGLLGMAFHPKYAANGKFYLDYTDPLGAVTVAGFQTSADPDSAILASKRVFLSMPKSNTNHNGGMIEFGYRDSYLYVGVGDGGSENDPNNLGQSDTTYFGKMLRINVDSANMIPPTNPFIDSAGYRPEIWAKGLRNPWRWSFDRLTGDMYIGDVGQNTWEEVDFQPFSSHGGENYGWRLMEGPVCFNPPTNCQAGVDLVLPIFDYIHQFGRCGVIGGYVYRGCAIPDLDGTYFMGDLCTGEIFSFRWNGSVQLDFQDRTTELGSAGISLASFGEDAKGELYLCDLRGNVYKIVPNGVPSQCSLSSCCRGTTGNVDGDPGDIVDISDLVAMINYLFFSVPVSSCFQEDDVDRSGVIDISDLLMLVDYLFFSGTLPVCP